LSEWHSDEEIENFEHLHVEYRYGYHFVDKIDRKNGFEDFNRERRLYFS